METSQRTPSWYGFRMPAEWEAHAGTWLAWPHNEDTWPGGLAAVRDVYVDIILSLHLSERINVYVNNVQAVESVLEACTGKEIDLSRVWLCEIKTDDAWARDHGPIYLTRDYEGVTELCLTNWIFNAWGSKYDPYDQDNAVPDNIARKSNLYQFHTKCVLEGGSIDVNGHGMLLATESCLLNPNRNPHLTRHEIEHLLMTHFGVRHIGWLGEGIAGDDTDGHVDDIARFVAETTVVTAIEEDPTDVNYKPLQDNLRRLKTMRDQDGTPLRVIELPMPHPVFDSAVRLPASYANFYIGNKIVLVPTFDQASDNTALELLGPLFPGRTIAGIPSKQLLRGLGGIHCITMQQPAFQRRFGLHGLA